MKIFTNSVLTIVSGKSSCVPEIVFLSFGKIIEFEKRTKENKNMIFSQNFIFFLKILFFSQNFIFFKISFFVNQNYIFLNLFKNEQKYS